jgi:uncharacterized membrane protein YfcA
MILALILAAGLAALVNGTIGYGFSSILTPIALLWMTSRVLLPAIVLVELGVNGVLLFRERKYLGATYPRVRPMILGLVPGVLLGAFLLASIAPSSARLAVYVVLLPIILLQVVGTRKVILNERPVGTTLGAGIGALYALTTISGPPLALFWRNQGMAKGEFRCAMAQLRCAEGSLTVVAYALFGLFTPVSVGLVPIMIVPVVIAVPLGTLLLAGFTRDFFSRFVMAADGVLVMYGLATVLGSLGWISSLASIALFGAGSLGIVLIAWNELRKIPFQRVSPRFPDRSFGWDPGI